MCLGPCSLYTGRVTIFPSEVQKQLILKVMKTCLNRLCPLVVHFGTTCTLMLYRRTPRSQRAPTSHCVTQLHAKVRTTTSRLEPCHSANTVRFSDTFPHATNIGMAQSQHGPQFFKKLPVHNPFYFLQGSPLPLPKDTIEPSHHSRTISP